MNLESFMNYHIIRRGYSNSKEVPAEEFMNVLENFFLSHLSTTEKEDDIYILFHKYLETIPNHDQAGEEIIHYLLSFLSILQEKKIKWQKKENFENAFWFYANNDECIESLNTNNLVDYSKTFNLVLCTLLDLQNKREEGIQR